MEISLFDEKSLIATSPDSIVRLVKGTTQYKNPGHGSRGFLFPAGADLPRLPSRRTRTITECPSSRILVV